MFDNLLVASIWNPTTISFETPFGMIYMSGFLNMFGASVRYPWRAVQQMQVANEAQVHYALSEVLS